MEILGGKTDFLGIFSLRNAALSPNSAHPFYLANAPDFSTRLMPTTYPSIKPTVETPSGIIINSTGEKTRDEMIKRLGAPPAFLQKLFGMEEPETFTEAGTGEIVTPEQTGGVANEAGGMLTGITTFIEGLVGRAAIIILGFIFVAVGLSLFKNPQIINGLNNASGGAIKAAKGAI